jgi:hypothetical protein
MTGLGDERGSGPRSVAEAGLYQRLRAHLAYLKMADAAAALPGLLDQAREQHLVLTAAMLDRLLQRAVVLGIDGPSYRLRSHQARTADLHRAVTS